MTPDQSIKECAKRKSSIKEILSNQKAIMNYEKFYTHSRCILYIYIIYISIYIYIIYIYIYIYLMRNRIYAMLCFLKSKHSEVELLKTSKDGASP